MTTLVLSVRKHVKLATQPYTCTYKMAMGVAIYMAWPMAICMGLFFRGANLSTKTEYMHWVSKP